MTLSLIEKTYRYLPILPTEWQRLGPIISGDVGADYLLIDSGLDSLGVRYMLVELKPPGFKLNFCASLADIHARGHGSAFGIRSALLIPFSRTHQRHQGHIGICFRKDHSFSTEDMDALEIIANRVLRFRESRCQ